MSPTNCKLIKNLLRSLRDLPLNTKLNPESAGSELAKCIRDDPERNERSNQEDGDTRKGRVTKSGVVQGAFVCGENTHDRKTTADVLAQPTNKNASPASGYMISKTVQVSRRAPGRKTYARAPQFPIVVASPASDFVSPLLSSR